MLAVRDTSIVGLVKEQIMAYASNDQALDHIELTPEEMADFYRDVAVTTAVGADFGRADNPIVVNIQGVKEEGDVPSSLWYQGVRIVRKD